MTSTALAIAVADGDTVADANTKITVLKALMDLGWSRPAASAIAQSWVAVEDWGPVAQQRRFDWISAHERKRNNLQGTLAFIDDLLRGLLFEHVGTPMQNAKDVATATKLVQPLLDFLGK
jgi:hypothetical protein